MKINKETEALNDALDKWFHEPGFNLETGHPAGNETGKAPTVKVSHLSSSGTLPLMEVWGQ